MHRSLLIVGWALAGCASAVEGSVLTESSDGAEVSVEASEAKSATSHESVPVRKASKPAPKTDGYVLGDADKRGVALGSPCPPKDPAAEEGKRSNGPELCGTQGRISLEHSHLGAIMQQDEAKLPCTPAPLPNGSDNQPRMPYQVSACVSDDFILISDVCVMCRVMSGNGVHARISELTADQRKFVMQVLHIEGDAPTDAEGFKKLLGKR